jgi:hypothetical protein
MVAVRRSDDLPLLVERNRMRRWRSPSTKGVAYFDTATAFAGAKEFVEGRLYTGGPDALALTAQAVTASVEGAHPLRCSIVKIRSDT